MWQCGNICIYASSSDVVAPDYFRIATRVGELIAFHNCTLIYGGANVGLMRAVADAVRSHGGKVVGVIQREMQEEGRAYDRADEMIVVDDLRERKRLLENRSDAFVALPGGFGTVEEIFEILLRKQLRLHKKPVIFVNTNGFYDCLMSFLEQAYSKQFVKEIYRVLYLVLNDVEDLFSYIETYVPPELPTKWFDVNSKC